MLVVMAAVAWYAEVCMNCTLETGAALVHCVVNKPVNVKLVVKTLN